ncbi:MAG TPA: polyribonucleotide nucleotidyltransferase [Pseudomonas sp.]|jgi:hypothetical protein|nr:polyribonucleotide nucleotidyltransferase [Pseudomonas sp.]
MRTPPRLLCVTLGGALLTQLAACGTLFYPERRGQIDGKLDPVVFALDAVGLLLYIVPGLIALGIDFATGAIYLPGGEKYSIAPEALRDAVDDQGQVNRQRLRAIIREASGLDLPLDQPGVIEQRGGVEQLAAHGLQPSA